MNSQPMFVLESKSMPTVSCRRYVASYLNIEASSGDGSVRGQPKACDEEGSFHLGSQVRRCHRGAESEMLVFTMEPSRGADEHNTKERGRSLDNPIDALAHLTAPAEPWWCLKQHVGEISTSSPTQQSPMLHKEQSLQRCKGRHNHYEREGERENVTSIKLSRRQVH